MDEPLISELWEMLAAMFEDMAPHYNPLNNPLSPKAMTFLLSVIFLLSILFVSYKILALYLGLNMQNKQKKLFLSVMNKTGELKQLAEKCAELGEEIDRHTNRKNNSKIVSYFTYRIAQEQKVPEDKALLYFCAAMVYDAGFLDSPEEFFYMESLIKKEKQFLKTHVERFYSYLAFVPKEYMTDFFAACLYHHENFSGTGFPECLKGKEIPLIARIIHIVESYTALTCKRNYHPVYSSKKAIKELAKFSGLYDREIVEILAKLV